MRSSSSFSYIRRAVDVDAGLADDDDPAAVARELRRRARADRARATRRRAGRRRARGRRSRPERAVRSSRSPRAKASAPPRCASSTAAASRSMPTTLAARGSRGCAPRAGRRARARSRRRSRRCRPRSGARRGARSRRRSRTRRRRARRLRGPGTTRLRGTATISAWFAQPPPPQATRSPGARPSTPAPTSTTTPADE